MYKVGVGESPMSIAGALSGDCNRYGELLAANPHKALSRVGGRVTFALLMAGELLHVPKEWERSRLRPHHHHGHHHPLPHGRRADGAVGDAASDRLGTNSTLLPGQSITSPNGAAALTMQPDGNLVLRNLHTGQDYWTSGTAGVGHHARMNWDGNLRVEDARNNRVWSNGAGGHKDAFARVQDDGQLYVWDGSNHQIWDAGASLARPNLTPGGHGAAHTAFGGVHVDVNLDRLAHDLGHFADDVVDDAKKFGPMILSEVQGIASLIPGLGTGISAAIGLAMALLSGGSPIVIAIRTAYGAIPIPPGIRNVTDPIVDGAVNFVEHPKNFTDVVVKTVRDQVPAGLPREVFDTLVKIIIKHQPILKVAEGVVTDVVKQAPFVQNVIAAMPSAGTALQSIHQLVPNGVHVDLANLPNLLQAANAATRVEHQVAPAALAAIAQQAQQSYPTFHAVAVMTSMAQLAHKVGGIGAAAIVVDHPVAAAAAIAHPLTAPRPPPPTIPIPPPPPVVLAPPPYARTRGAGYPAREARAYPPYAHGYPPHMAPGRHGVHGTLAGCAPDCAKWSEPVAMDHRMSQVARMLLTARSAPSTTAKGPDGVTYRFDRTDDGAVTARTCLGLS